MLKNKEFARAQMEKSIKLNKEFKPRSPSPPTKPVTTGKAKSERSTTAPQTARQNFKLIHRTTLHSHSLKLTLLASPASPKEDDLTDAEPLGSSSRKGSPPPSQSYNLDTGVKTSDIKRFRRFPKTSLSEDNESSPLVRLTDGGVDGRKEVPKVIVTEVGEAGADDNLDGPDCSVEAAQALGPNGRKSVVREEARDSSAPTASMKRPRLEREANEVVNTDEQSELRSRSRSRSNPRSRSRLSDREMVDNPSPINNKSGHSNEELDKITTEEDMEYREDDQADVHAEDQYCDSHEAEEVERDQNHESLRSQADHGGHSSDENDADQNFLDEDKDDDEELRVDDDHEHPHEEQGQLDLSLLSTRSVPPAPLSPASGNDVYPGQQQQNACTEQVQHHGACAEQPQHVDLVKFVEKIRQSSQDFQGQCDWCFRRASPQFSLPVGDAGEELVKLFCSEPCFSHYRRAIFKAGKVCDNCNQATKSNLILLPDGNRNLVFCSLSCQSTYTDRSTPLTCSVTGTISGPTASSAASHAPATSPLAIPNLSQINIAQLQLVQKKIQSHISALMTQAEGGGGSSKPSLPSPTAGTVKVKPDHLLKKSAAPMAREEKARENDSRKLRAMSGCVGTGGGNAIRKHSSALGREANMSRMRRCNSSSGTASASSSVSQQPSGGSSGRQTGGHTSHNHQHHHGAGGLMSPHGQTNLLANGAVGQEATSSKHVSQVGGGPATALQHQHLQHQLTAHLAKLQTPGSLDILSLHQLLSAIGQNNLIQLLMPKIGPAAFPGSSATPRLGQPGMVCNLGGLPVGNSSLMGPPVRPPTSGHSTVKPSSVPATSPQQSRSTLVPPPISPLSVSPPTTPVASGQTRPVSSTPTAPVQHLMPPLIPHQPPAIQQLTGMPPSSYHLQPSLPPHSAGGSGHPAAPSGSAFSKGHLRSGGSGRFSHGEERSQAPTSQEMAHQPFQQYPHLGFPYAFPPGHQSTPTQPGFMGSLNLPFPLLLPVPVPIPIPIPIPIAPSTTSSSSNTRASSSFTAAEDTIKRILSLKAGEPPTSTSPRSPAVSPSPLGPSQAPSNAHQPSAGPTTPTTMSSSIIDSRGIVLAGIRAEKNARKENETGIHLGMTTPPVANAPKSPGPDARASTGSSEPPGSCENLTVKQEVIEHDESLTQDNDGRTEPRIFANSLLNTSPSRPEHQGDRPHGNRDLKSPNCHKDQLRPSHSHPATAHHSTVVTGWPLLPSLVVHPPIVSQQAGLLALSPNAAEATWRQALPSHNKRRKMASTGGHCPQTPSNLEANLHLKMMVPASSSGQLTQLPDPLIPSIPISTSVTKIKRDPGSSGLSLHPPAPTREHPRTPPPTNSIVVDGATAKGPSNSSSSAKIGPTNVGGGPNSHSYSSKLVISPTTAASGLSDQVVERRKRRALIMDR